ncbi:acyl-CoA dehydrogenase family protein [Cryptosporangium aurantiacum]|uniref:Acyl-CoA dehydrogenase n=1 Tax=Cryptosporangium aurantiacum TaxID=134849 RepID=A0A1M7Q0K2_9ACTN|nr:acyl-CoA dehydrogenase family protein [Cryptosporangium aurantiacum]SHN23712.1 Acyl-CoA dehydrogenase [Cryptosporangium aurantiacum]
MDLSLLQLTAEEQAFADDVRSYLGEHMTDEGREHERRTGDGFWEPVHLALGRRGWLFPTSPVVEGGAGLDPVRARILELELVRHEVPGITRGTTGLVWPSVKKFGQPALLAELGSGVTEGRIRFALGYTEPDGGSDIAAAKTRAVRDGDSWMINGAKMFTTGAHNCQYTFLLTRTDPSLPKHAGLTMFLVPLDAPGVEIHAIRTYGGERTNIVYFGDVLIDDRYRLGGVNAGWSVLHEPLDAEHALGTSDVVSDISGGITFSRLLEHGVDAVARWAKTANPSAAEDSAFLEALGRAAMEAEVARVTPGPMGRIKGSDVLVQQAPLLLDLVGPQALLPRGADGALDDGLLEFNHRFAQGTATYGGTVEVFRGIVAQHVLGLPRPTYPGSKALVAPRSTADPR